MKVLGKALLRNRCGRATLLALGLIFVLSPASALANGTISGTVTDATSPHPVIVGVQVQLINATTQQFVAQTTTDGAGTYSFGNEPNSNYNLCFFPPPSDLYHVAQCYNNKNPYGSVALDTVTVNNANQTVNVQLADGGVVTGAVKDATNSTGIPDVVLEAVDSSGTVLAIGCSGSTGAYSVHGVPAGSVDLYFNDTTFFGSPNPCNNGAYPLYNQRYYLNKASLGTANSVTVTAGSATPLSDELLTPMPSTISGAVKDATSNAPLSGATATLYTAAGTQVTSTTTNAGGAYTLGNVNPGNYKIGFSAPGHATQFYNGKSSFATADAIPVSAGSTHNNVNASLGPQSGGGTKANCTLSINSSKVKLKGKKKGKVTLTVHCDQAVSGTVSGKLKIKKKKFSLGPVSVSVTANQNATLTLKLSGRALKKLKHAKGSASLTLSVSNANGTSTATASGKLHH